MSLSAGETEKVWHTLTYWVLNKNESKIVRVNALQGLFDLAKINSNLKRELENTMAAIEHEMISSIQARIRKIAKALKKS